MPVSTPDAVIKDLAPPFWSPTPQDGDALLRRDAATSKPAPRTERAVIEDEKDFILIPNNVERVFTSCYSVD